jgi:CheY-like chemotaxis protein
MSGFIPRVVGHAGCTHRAVVSSPAPFPPRVLVIDPDPRVRETVRALLEPYGFECETVGDGLEGVARFEEGGWDLVLTALGMPQYRGWEIVDAIRRGAAAKPIVLMAGHGDGVVVAQPFARQVWVVRKPFPPGMLTGTVVAALYSQLA